MQSRMSARKVASLSGYVVALAYIVGITAVALGALVLLFGFRTGATAEVRIASGAAALIVVAAGLVQAVFIALIGRYAQMRAEEILGE